MKKINFNEYCDHKDVHTFFESHGIEIEHIAIAVAAMNQWTESTAQMLAALEKLPETYGAVINSYGKFDGERPSMASNRYEEEIMMELQRSKNLLVDVHLDEVQSQINQFASRISSACKTLGTSSFID